MCIQGLHDAKLKPPGGVVMDDDERERSLCIFCGEDAPRLNLFHCPSCGGRPETVEDLAYAMAYSRVLYTDATLDRIADELRDGKTRPTPPKQDFEQLLAFAQSVDVDCLVAPLRVKH